MSYGQEYGAYGDYTEETAPCDPYYEDCEAMMEEPCDPTMEGAECPEEEMMTEEGSAMNPLVLGWGAIPVMSLMAGFWQYSDWSDAVGFDEWSQAYMVEIGVSLISLPLWGGAVFMAGGPLDAIFPISSKVNILLSVVQLYLVYRADDAYPNATWVESQSTNFGYFAQVFGVVYGAASAMAVMDQYAGEETAEEEYAEEDVYGDEAVEDEYAVEDNYGDYGYYY